MIKSLQEIPIRKTIGLWEEKWNREALIKQRAAIHETAFNRGFRQIPFSDELSLFKSIDKAIVYGVTYKDFIDVATPFVTSVDLSTKTRPGTVIFTFAINNDGKKIVVDVQRGSWTAPETAKMISSVYDTYNPLFVAIEDNAYQVALPEMMKISGYDHIPIVPFHTGTNKNNIEIGLQSLEVELINGLWIIPFESVHEINCGCGICSLVQEARAYPLGESDDAVMAWWIGKEAYREKSGSYWDVDDISAGNKGAARSLRGIN